MLNKPECKVYTLFYVHSYEHNIFLFVSVDTNRRLVIVEQLQLLQEHILVYQSLNCDFYLEL